ncbi:MAG: trypsin-like peptidase domain-containing protein [Nitrospinales bacterium]
MRILPFLVITLLTHTSLSAAALDFDPKQVYRETAPAVVLIAAFDPRQPNQSLGTGAIIRSDGLVLTNAHVIFSDKLGRPYSKLRVFLKPRHITGNIKKDTTRKHKARLLNYSTSLDLALLKIQGGASPFPHLEFADSSRIEIGEPVLAIGHPEQGGLWTLTTGTISSQIENFQEIAGKNVFQTETSINKGNSGGPLIDRYGAMVGINSNIAREGKGGLVITDINFSIKSNVALRWLDSLGYSFVPAVPGAFAAMPSLPQEAGIVPMEEPPSAKPRTAVPGEPRILTDRHPYKAEDLRQQVETEMENMMEEMRGKIRSGRPAAKTQKTN